MCVIDTDFKMTCSSADLCGVGLTPTLAGAFTMLLLDHRQHMRRCLHHHLVEGAGHQIVHETDEAKGERSIGLIKTCIPIILLQTTNVDFYSSHSHTQYRVMTALSIYQFYTKLHVISLFI